MGCKRRRWEIGSPSYTYYTDNKNDRRVKKAVKFTRHDSDSSLVALSFFVFCNISSSYYYLNTSNPTQNTKDRPKHTQMFSRSVLSTARSYYTSISQPAQATHHLITLVRSPIGLTKASKQTLVALGLHRLRQSVLQPFGEVTAGRILKVKELVQVANVTKEEGEALMKRRRGEGSGVELSGRVYGGGKGLVEREI